MNGLSLRRRRNAPSDIWLGWAQGWILAATLAASLDLAVGGASPLALAAAVGLGVLFGLIAATMAWSITVLARALPWAAAGLLWLACAAAAFGGLAEELGAFDNLEGKYRVLALGVLGACAVATVGASLLAWAVQLRAGEPQSWLERRPRWFRLLAATSMVMGGALALAGDRLIYPDLYPAAHLALQLTGLALLATAVYSAGRVPAGPASPVARWGIRAAVAALALSPFAILTEARSPLASVIGERPLSALVLGTARTLVDVDGDGFAALLAGGDCAPLDARVHPAANEVPQNGIDDNCLGGDASSALDAIAEPPPIPSEPSPVDVVLITIDTLRADRMSAYGYERPTTPHLARWAEEATRFEAAYTSGLWTTIAVPSLLRGLYPRRLRWSRMATTRRGTVRPATAELRPNERLLNQFVLPVDDPRMPLPELLQRRGMHTMAIVDDGFSDILRPEWGFARGFDQYERVKSLPSRQRDDAGTASRAIALLEGRPKDKRFFLWAHFFGPHMPNKKHDSMPDFGTSAPDRYDHEVAYVDQHVGRLLAAIAELPGPVAVIVTSDHGEYFHANGRSRSHGTNASEANVRIPLLVRAPGFEGRTSQALVSTVDVLPTILGLTATPAPKRLDGLDLRSVVAGRSDTQRRVVFADSFIMDKHKNGAFRFDLAAAIGRHHKLVEQRFARTSQLVVRGTDAVVAAGAQRGTRLQLNQALDAYLETTGGTPVAHP